MLTKTVQEGSVAPGATNEYTIRVKNIGATTARDVVITDDVPQWLKVIDLKSSKGEIVVDGQKVSAFPSVLEPGEEMSITIKVQVHGNAPDGTITNWGVVTTSSDGDKKDNNTSSATFTVKRPPAPPKDGGNPVPPARRATPVPTAKPVPSTRPQQVTTQERPPSVLPKAGWASGLGDGTLPVVLTLIVLAVSVAVGVVAWRRRRARTATGMVAGPVALESRADQQQSFPAHQLDHSADLVHGQQPYLGPELPPGGDVDALPPPALLDRSRALRYADA